MAICSYRLPSFLWPTSLIDENVVLLGSALDQLMNRAGALVAGSDAIVCGGSILVIAGSGNNGGDAYVAARHLIEQGRSVTSGPSSAQSQRQTAEAGTLTTTFRPRPQSHR